MTLQGDDLFLDGLTEPYKSESLELIRRQIAGRRSLRVGERLLHRFMARLPAHPARPDAHRAARRQHRRLSRTRRTPAATRDVVHDRLLRAHRAGEGTAQSGRGLPHPAAGARPAAVAPARGRLHGRRSADVSRRHHASAGVVGARRASSSTSGTVDRDDKARFLQSIDVLSVPSGYHEPKGLYLLEAMAAGVPVVQPNHGAFPEMLGRTGGGILSRVGAAARCR